MSLARWPFEEIAQVGVWFNAVHLAYADQASGATGPIPAALIMAGKPRIAAVHGWTTARVLDEVAVDVDAVVGLAARHGRTCCARRARPELRAR